MLIERQDFLPARMNALWFTYVALFLFALLPEWGIELGALEIYGYSLLATVLVNIWSFYKEKPIMDERKQTVVTEAMAWAFVVVSLALVPAGATGVEIEPDMIRDTASLGLWTWIIVFSVKNLYQKYGEDLW